MEAQVLPTQRQRGGLPTYIAYIRSEFEILSHWLRDKGSKYGVYMKLLTMHIQANHECFKAVHLSAMSFTALAVTIEEAWLSTSIKNSYIHSAAGAFLEVQMCMRDKNNDFLLQKTDCDIAYSFPYFDLVYVTTVL
ncbi:hypothetical protein CHS0354_023010 [Potamilus streckersoni]|uniref:Uncharacterized protein n=1 Tax=Potamilus streckersoni TaxID=2493646 RepID=A0AAE0SV19_9BIVA|nr:hypothetical protein CHS0354_023010 [Potamilus streckersoni]